MRTLVVHMPGSTLNYTPRAESIHKIGNPLSPYMLPVPKPAFLPAGFVENTRGRDRVYTPASFESQPRNKAKDYVEHRSNGTMNTKRIKDKMYLQLSRIQTPRGETVIRERKNLLRFLPRLYGHCECRQSSHIVCDPVLIASGSQASAYRVVIRHYTKHSTFQMQCLTTIFFPNVVHKDNIS